LNPPGGFWDKQSVSSSELPGDVARFLKEQIRSIEQLEILLLLRGSAVRMWTTPEVFGIVRSSERSITDTLTVLHRQGLLRQTAAAYQYSPADDALRQIIDQLAELYAERRVRIVETIYSERSSDVDEFAKAFRLRKEQ
jgi:hypothetical protein